MFRWVRVLDGFLDRRRANEASIALGCDQAGVERREHLSDRIRDRPRDARFDQRVTLPRWRNVDDRELCAQHTPKRFCHVPDRIRRSEQVDGLGPLRRIQ